MKRSFAQKAAVGLLAVSALAGCGPRQSATEVGIQTTGWGKEVAVSDQSGLKCYFPGCWPGEDWHMISTGEYPLHIVATPPNTVVKDKSDAPSQIHDSTASGVVKTKEGLTLQGAVTIWVQLQNVKDKKSDIEHLYRTFPPNGLNSAEYVDKIMTRLAQHALDSVQQAYRTVSVTEVTTKTNGKDGIAEDIKTKVGDTFKEAGFGVVAVKSVVLAGINLGETAESANQQIGLAQVQMAVADKQVAAAEKLTKAQNALAPITQKLIKDFKESGVGSGEIANVLCLHEKMISEDFAKRHPQGCFSSVNLPYQR